MSALRPLLARVESIKVKLGVLVGVSVLVAAVLATAVAESVPPWLSIPVVVLVALALTQLIAAGMTQPLREMTRAAAQMARGDYTLEVNTSSRDEVGQLARSFNTMAADLAVVDRQRRELISMVSHEIRTPLAALTAQLENFVDGVVEPTPQRLRETLHQADRLSELTRDLLDLSRIEAGVATLRVEEFGLAALVQDAAGSVRTLRPDVHVDIAIDPGLLVSGDRLRLRQVAANLLDNGTRHATAQVHVTANSGADEWALQVHDDGPGVPEDRREQIFERFGTAEPGTGSTGLGLAVARMIATLHGGRLDLIWDPTSVGARFDLRVPHTLTEESTPVSMPPTTPPKPQPKPQATGQDIRLEGGQPVGQPVAAYQQPRRDSAMDFMFGDAWPERNLAVQPALLFAAVIAGVFAGAVLPFDNFGIGWTLVLLACGGVAAYAARARRDAFTWIAAGLCGGLAFMPGLRDAEWVTVLCLLAAGMLMCAALVRGRSVLAFVIGMVAWPLAAFRGLPWWGRTVRTISGQSRAPALLRTAVLSLVALGIFGLLFANADALFGKWFNAVTPHIEAGEWVGRTFVGIVFTVMTLAAAYLAVNPPATDDRFPRPAPLRSRYEWLVPVLVIDALFVAFLIAQSRATFGGHDYIEQQTGVTYAQYVHSGFTEMNVATVLSLMVLGLAARRASRETATDRLWLRIGLGVLCLSTLVVIGSSMWRMTQYIDAYGMTRLRYLVFFFEGWLAIVFVALLVMGAARLRASWWPRVAAIAGAVVLLGFGLSNPDARIAEYNLTSGGMVTLDVAYLSGLSDDADEVIGKYRPDLLPCIKAGKNCPTAS